MTKTLKTFTVKQFAELWGLTERTVRQMVRQNHLVCFHVAGELYIQEPNWHQDGKTGTGTIEDLYILRGNEVADILGVTPRYIRYLVERGKLSCVYIKRHRRYNLTDVRRLIALKMQGTLERKKRSYTRDGVVLWARKRLSAMEEEIKKENQQNA